MRLIFALFVTIGLNSSAYAQSTGLFTEYNALTTPRADVPIGALWLPSVGPAGPGQSDNVTVTRGVSSNNLSSNLKKKIGLGLSNLLGLNAGSTTITSVELQDVEIHRVGDMSRLNVAAGQQVLYEGLKAGRITVTIDRTSAANLNAAAAARGLPITASVDVGNNRKITFNGSNLFLAYQVVSFGSPQVSIKRHKYKDSLVTINNFHRFTFHMNGEGDNARVSQVRYQNLASPLPDGSFPTQIIPVKELQRGNGYYGIWDFTLPRYISGNRLTATGVTIDHERNRICFNPDNVANTDGSRLCISGPTEGTIEIRSSTFKIGRVNNPSATY